jgi:hypothetical protein
MSTIIGRTRKDGSKAFVPQQASVNLSDHHVRKDLAGLDRFHSGIAPHRHCNRAVAENLSNEFNLARPIFEDDRAGGVPELMNGHLPGRLPYRCVH